jgi:hypothetical protein
MDKCQKDQSGECCCNCAHQAGLMHNPSVNMVGYCCLAFLKEERMVMFENFEHGHCEMHLKNDDWKVALVKPQAQRDKALDALRGLVDEHQMWVAEHVNLDCSCADCEKAHASYHEARAVLEEGG